MRTTSKVFLSLLLGLALGLPSLGEVAIQDLNVRRQGASVNIRVSVVNPGKIRQLGPVLIDLYIRKNAQDPWLRIKTWNDITLIQPGYHVARDYFDKNNANLAALAAQGAFDARAVVRLPGGVKDIESVRSWKDKE